MAICEKLPQQTYLILGAEVDTEYDGIKIPAISREHPVQGHVTRNGTYVQPHQQTNPNADKRDNWSSKPNINPYTGKRGTKQP